jgi:ubiquinone/menaquinone biosynthesis C-methylase UbiE
VSWLTRALHSVVARPRVYDACQLAAGAGVVRRHLRGAIIPLRDSAKWVLDIGGGTGASRAHWRADARYLCLDYDPMKLAGYRAKVPGGLAVQADATAVPLADGSVDAVVCTQVTHHLTEAQLEQMIGEAARVLRAGAHFVMLDAVWRPARVPGRLLWRYDRGSFPRTDVVLREAMERHFEILRWEEFSLWHAYVVGVGRPRK